MLLQWHIGQRNHTAEILVSREMVALLQERGIAKPEVVGSNPAGGSNQIHL